MDSISISSYQRVYILATLNHLTLSELNRKLAELYISRMSSGKYLSILKYSPLALPTIYKLSLLWNNIYFFLHPPQYYFIRSSNISMGLQTVGHDSVWMHTQYLFNRLFNKYFSSVQEINYPAGTKALIQEGDGNYMLRPYSGQNQKADDWGFRNTTLLPQPVQFTQSCPILWSHGLQHARLLHSSPTPGACSNSCPLSQWCNPTISSSVVPFSSCL